MQYYTTKMIHEVIALASKAESKADKIKILRQNESWALKDILRGAVDPKVKWLLPSGDPPYTPSSIESVPSNLLKRNRDFAYFVDCPTARNLPPFKREKIFMDILESVHPKDAEILLIMKEKKSLGKGLTLNLVKEAFPNLIP